MNGYKTLLQEANDEYIVNKSRFIGSAAPVETPEQALAFLDKIRQQYKDATHNCYAYIIGKNAGIMRYSDDGEPGGMPIIEVMKARGVVDCAVVVTRYFGGILLGAGGLAALPIPIAALAGAFARTTSPSNAPVLAQQMYHPEYLAGALIVLGTAISAGIRLWSWLRPGAVPSATEAPVGASEAGSSAEPGERER